MTKEAGRKLPQTMITAYLDLLEEKGLVKQQEGYADSTPAFRKLFVKAVESLKSWYNSSPEDDPQSLIAQEMARLVLKVSPAKIEQGLVNPRGAGKTL